MRSFIYVRWIHAFPNEPVDLYSELDGERNEVRKVDIYGDGRVVFADEMREFGIGLGELPIPSLEEIAESPEFQPREIQQEEFEEVWKAAMEKVRTRFGGTTFYQLEPEVAGGLGPSTKLDTSCHPPKVFSLEYRFDGWQGDDLVESFPCFVVTRRLADALVAAKLTGFILGNVEVSTSDEFDELHPDTHLPEFLWLEIKGVAAFDDIVMTADHRMMVSQRALHVLQSMSLDHCEIEQVNSPSGGTNSM